MPQKSAQQIANETLLQINNHFSSTEELKISIAQIERLFTDQFNWAFLGLTPSDKAALYKKLSLQLHPDKLRNSNQAFALYLKNPNTIGLAQHCLNIAYSKKLTHSIIYNLIRGLRLLSLEHQRYLKPIDFLSVLISESITFLTLFSWGIIYSISFIQKYILQLPAFLEERLVNYVSYGKYDQEANRYHASEKAISLATRTFLYFSRYKMISLSLIVHPEANIAEKMTEMTNEEFMQYLKESMLIRLLSSQKKNNLEDITLFTKKIQDSINYSIDKNIIIDMRTEILFRSKLILELYRHPLPSSFFSTIASLTSRTSLIFFLLIFHTVATILKSSSQLLSECLFYSALGIGVVARGVSNLLINLPLYLLDGCKAIKHSLSVYLSFGSKCPTQRLLLCNSSHYMMAKKMPVGCIEIKDNDVEEPRQPTPSNHDKFEMNPEPVNEPNTLNFGM